MKCFTQNKQFSVKVRCWGPLSDVEFKVNSQNDAECLNSHIGRISLHQRAVVLLCLPEGQVVETHFQYNVTRCLDC